MTKEKPSQKITKFIKGKVCQQKPGFYSFLSENFANNFILSNSNILKSFYSINEELNYNLKKALHSL